MIGTDGKVEQLLKHCQEKLFQEYTEQLKRLNGKDRFKNLANIRDRDGYMCELRSGEDGAYCLIEHHCPIASIAKKIPQICSYEHNLFETALGTKLVRREHLVSGDKCCSYEQTA